MDDKTLEYMKKRVDEATRFKRVISDLKHKRQLAIEIATTVCARNSALGYYNADLPFPDDARAIVVAAIDAHIKELEAKLAEL